MLMQNFGATIKKHHGMFWYFLEWPIATQIWVVSHNQYGISALVSQMSFGGETIGSVAKCRLFSQATLIGKCPQSSKEEEQLLRGQGLLFFGTLIVSNYYTNGFKLNALS